MVSRAGLYSYVLRDHISRIAVYYNTYGGYDVRMRLPL